MRELSAFTASFCGICIAIGGLHMLIPEGKMSKTIRYVIVLTLLTAFIGVFSVNFNLNFNGSERNFEISKDAMSERMITAVFERALSANDIDFEKILIFTDNSEEGSITITKIQVFSQENPERIISVIGNGKAYEVEVIN